MYLNILKYTRNLAPRIVYIGLKNNLTHQLANQSVFNAIRRAVFSKLDYL